MDAITWALHVFEENKERDFLIDSKSGQVLTYHDVFRSACAIADFLNRKGLHKGDRVAVILHNSLPFAQLYFGCLFSGIVTVPINPVLTQSEIRHIIKQSGVSLVIASEKTLPLIEKNVLGPSQDVLLLAEDGEAEGKADHDRLNVAQLADVEGFEPFAGVVPTDTMTIVHTSGTSGIPKGVVHSIADLIDNGRLFANNLGIGPDNRFFGILALSYLGGYYNLLMLPFAAQSSVVLSRAFDASLAINFWEPAVENQVNTLWLVPTILSILLEVDRDERGADYCREHVKLALVGTAPLPAALKNRFEQRYGLTLYENYALSETFFLTTHTPHIPYRQGSVGRLLPGVQLTVKDEQGKALRYGAEGEISVTTPYLMDGYLDPETGQPDALPLGEWFPTGDVGVLTATGDLFVTGRKKDLIIRGGINISPAGIEEVLHSHPAVAACAVVGVPHKLYGEEIGAVVKLKDEFRFADEEPKLKAFINKELSSIHRPAYLLEIDEFPMNSAGKIKKDALRVIVSEKLGVRQDLWKRPEPQPGAKQSPALTGSVRRRIERPEASLVEQLSAFPTSILSDCLNRMHCMDGCVRPIGTGKAFCGPAVTVEEVEGGNLMSHIALELLQPGDVLVIDAKGVTSRSVFGGLQLLMARKRGCVGVVVNGAIRDIEAAQQADPPVFAVGASPAGPLKGWGGTVNYPIACAGVTIQPGDIVAADDDGVVVVPAQLATQLVPVCEERAELEKSWFERVENGESTVDVVELREKIEKLGIRFE